MDKDELIYEHTFSLNPWEKEDLSSHLIRQNSYFDKRVTQISDECILLNPSQGSPIISSLRWMIVGVGQQCECTFCH